MLPLEAYMRERGRRCVRPAMYQRWRDLLFLHFCIEPDAIRALVPAQLQIDTFPDDLGGEMAWIGLVPFRMEGVRLRFLPPFPGHGAFPETNVRTYVHLNGRPGVWFFSLDAASGLACRAGRSFFHLPYQHAAMSVVRSGENVRYCSHRRTGEARLSIEAQLSGDPSPTEAGTLEFFLLERYLLFATDGAKWFGGNVHHPPYRVRRAELASCTESLTLASGIPVRPFTHQMFVERVDVRIGSLHHLAICSAVPEQ